MDKNSIKKYAVWARRELIERVSQKALQYGIMEQDAGDPNADSVNGHLLSAAEKKQRRALIDKVKKDGYEQAMEEVAYTWFNRFAALRFMEVNGYLPSHVRVFTDDAGTFKPQILAEAINLELDGLDMEKVYALKDLGDNETLFKYLIIVQCNALSKILPGMFQKIDDYTELLFPDNLLRESSVVEQMVTMIPEEDWQDQVQIIGWLYQYYNTEPKDKVFADLKKNIKISKENIPAATQLFTPDWIVRYMVENSLGRLWVEGHPNNELKSNWKYYLEEAEQEPEVQRQLAEIRKDYAALTPEQIKCIDPCSGSGHICAYLFDVLVQIYEAYGYTAREAVSSIVRNNLYGLDIDERAAQLAYFSVMMKARQYDRRFFSRGIQPHIYAIQESNGIGKDVIDYFVNGDAARKKAIDTIVAELRDAKEYGSILTVTPQNWSALYDRFDEIFDEITLFREPVLNQLLPLVQCAEVMAQKYHVVTTNPPYMGSSNMDAVLSEYVKKHYSDSKSDLFAVCIERGNQMVCKNGINCMVTMQSWMFLSSFEKLRSKILSSRNITNLMHMENMVMGIAFGTAVTCFRNCRISGYKGTYNHIKFSDIVNDEPDQFPVLGNRFAQVSTDNFSKIPGSPVAYWVSKNILYCFEKMNLVRDNFRLLAGTSTGDNTQYQRLWYEVAYSNISRNAPIDMTKRWYPCNTGGDFRKYSLNEYTLIDWENDGYRIKNHVNSRGKIGSAVRNRDYFFKAGITWNKLSSSNFGVRYVPAGYISDDTARMIMAENEQERNDLLGFLCSKVCKYFLALLSPTLSFTNSELQRLPIDKMCHGDVISIVQENVRMSEIDSSSFETSWDFIQHPLV